MFIQLKIQLKLYLGSLNLNKTLYLNRKWYFIWVYPLFWYLQNIFYHH